MKHTIATIILLTFVCFCNKANAQNEMYDSALARKLNADEYGMKYYVLVMLKKGSLQLTDTNKRDSIFRGHMNNIQRLASENKLVLAGPMDENDKNYEGIFVFNTGNLDEARQWLSTDPAFQAKALDAELYAWYGPAALQEIISIDKKLHKKHF